MSCRSIALIVGAFLCSVGVALAFGYACAPSSEGIHANKSGQAVYADGGFCAINATPDIDLVTFQELYLWCAVHHMEYLSKVQDEN